MDFGGRYLLAATRTQVWAALNDTGMLKAAIPGCRRLDWTGQSTLEMELQVNFGIIKPVFAGDLTLSGISPTDRYTLAGKGRGGFLGLAEGAADISLSDAGSGTELVFTARGGASGKIMNLGGALIGNSAQKVIDGFFERFAAAMGTEVTVLAPPVEF